MKNAVVYARFSSHRQGEQSIEGQISEAQKYAATHDLRIIREYVDRAISGRTDDRAAFQQMLKDTEKKQFEVIIVWKIDRFGRNREEITINKHRCKKNGVSIVRVAEDIPDSPEGIILDGLFDALAEYYSVQLSQNVSRGMRVAAQKGQIVGGHAPFGYKAVNHRYTIDPDRAPEVTRIFEMYAGDCSITDILDDLKRRGVTNAKGKPLDKSAVHTILKNERYTGVYIYKDIRIEGAVPKLVERSVYERVQELMKRNRKAPERAWGKSEYLLSEKLFCGHCGTQMTGVSGTNHDGIIYYYYRCKGRDTGCKKKSIRRDVIEPAVIRCISEVLHDEKTFDYIVQKVWEYYESTLPKTDDIGILKRRAAEIERQKEAIYDAIKQGFYEKSMNQQMADLNDRLDDIYEEIATAKVNETLYLTREYLEAFLLEMRDMNIDDPESRKRLIETFVNAIYLYDDKFLITFNYGNGSRTVTLEDLKKFEHEGFTSTNTGNVQTFLFFGSVFCVAKRISPR